MFITVSNGIVCTKSVTSWGLGLVLIVGYYGDNRLIAVIRPMPQGATENAGVEVIRAKLQGWKMQE